MSDEKESLQFEVYKVKIAQASNSHFFPLQLRAVTWS